MTDRLTGVHDFLGRYFKGASGATGPERKVARVLDANPPARAILERAVKRYDAMDDEARRARFDPRILELTKSRLAPLDLVAVRKRFDELAKVSSTAPAAPTRLTAKNVSLLPDPDTGVGKYAIALKWSDQSANEDGFVINRVFKPAGSGSALPPVSYAGTVGANVTAFTDTLSAPPVPGKQNQFCYQVVAYRTSSFVKLGQAPEKITSPPSNFACAYYDPLLAQPPLPPDADNGSRLATTPARSSKPTSPRFWRTASRCFPTTRASPSRRSIATLGLPSP